MVTRLEQLGMKMGHAAGQKDGTYNMRGKILLDKEGMVLPVRQFKYLGCLTHEDVIEGILAIPTEILKLAEKTDKAHTVGETFRPRVRAAIMPKVWAVTDDLLHARLLEAIAKSINIIYGKPWKSNTMCAAARVVFEEH